LHLLLIFLVVAAAVAYIIGDTADPIYDAEAKASASISLGWIALIILAIFIWAVL
jgi:hypothetical protein